MKHGVIIGGALLAALLFFSSSASADEKEKKPKEGSSREPPDADPGVEIDPGKLVEDLGDLWGEITEPLPSGPNPLEPYPVPQQGAYYQVQKHDSATLVATQAGLRARQWRSIRDHERNRWIAELGYRNKVLYGNELGMPFARWFDPPGWKTTCHWETRPGQVFPVIYIPTRAEADDLGW